MSATPQTPEGPLEGAEPAAQGSVEVRLARPEDDPALEAFVDAARGTVFQHPAWRRAVQRAFGHEPADLVALRDGAVVGCLPMMRCRGLFGGEHLISSPYGVYGGPLAEDRELHGHLIGAALTEARQRRVGRLELRSREPLEHPELVGSDLYVTFAKELPESAEAVLSTMKKDERRLVRRAADTHGLSVDVGPWFVGDLVRLFHASKQRLGSPGLPLRWFHCLQRELGQSAPVHVVRREREVVAASMSFVDGDALRMYYIGTTPEANRAYAATSFLIAELQRWALERGLRVFDLGRSRRDAGAVRFKRNQGFAPADLHYAYGLVRSRSVPRFTPSNPKTAVLRNSWSRLPGWACTRLSSRLARFLP